MYRPNITGNRWLLLTIPTAILLAVAAGAGFLIDDMYHGDTPTLRAITQGIDCVVLVVFLPALIGSAVLAWRGSVRGTAVWLGMMGILIYNYGFNSLNLRFSAFFLVHVALLGCALYAFIGRLVTLDMSVFTTHPVSRIPKRTIGVFLLVVAVLFYGVWLREIGVALLAGVQPASVRAWAVPTSAVHVIDIAIVLPATIMVAIWLLRAKPIGYVLAGVLLVVIVTMGLGLLAGGLWQIRAGVPFRTEVLAVFAVISFVALVLLIAYLRGLPKLT